jgi:hypothetical protein
MARRLALLVALTGAFATAAARSRASAMTRSPPSETDTRRSHPSTWTDQALHGHVPKLRAALEAEVQARAAIRALCAR